MAMKRSALYRQAEWNLMGCSWRRSTLAQWILNVEQYGGINKRKGIFKCAYLVFSTPGIASSKINKNILLTKCSKTVH